MKKALPTLLLTLIAFALTACSGDDDGGASQALDIFFAPENADALAHAALPEATDLPGAGWEVTAKDDFGEDDEGDGMDFETLAASEPACSQFSALANLGGLFGGSSDDELPAGRAQIKFENAQSEGLLPNGVEVKVEIDETVAEATGGWEIVRNVLESEDFDACMLAVFNQSFGEMAEEGDFKIEVESADASSPAPNNGATMAFDLYMEISGISLDLAMGMYFWPYGNAEVTVSFTGSQDSLNSDLTGPTLDAVVDKLGAAAAATEG